MTNPVTAVKTAYATEEEAFSVWASIKGNDHLAIVACQIGLGNFKPADSPVCWIILPTYAVIPQ